MGCLECVTRCAEAEECVYSASGECGAAARVLNVVKADTLGVDDVERDGKTCDTKSSARVIRWIDIDTRTRAS